MLQDEEKDLITKARSGDLTSFSSLIKIHQGRIFAFLIVRLNNRHEAEDFTQEVFLTAFKKLKDFDTEMPMGPWLRGIATNMLKNFWRKKKAISAGGNEELQLLIDNKFEDNHINSTQADALDLMKGCIQEMDSESADLIKLRYLQEKPLNEIQKNLNINHSTLTMRLHRIRDEIRKCINRKLQEI
jgi:RNA polymerase sigma-70 factor, ECF subfamily